MLVDDNIPVPCLRVKNWFTESELIGQTTNCLGAFEGDRTYDRNVRRNQEEVYIPLIKAGSTNWYAVVGVEYKYRILHVTTMEPKREVYRTPEEAIQVLMTLDP